MRVADDRVPADGGERGHEEDVADSGSTAGDLAMAVHSAGIAVDRGDADQGGDAPTASAVLE